VSFKGAAKIENPLQRIVLTHLLLRQLRFLFKDFSIHWGSQTALIKRLLTVTALEKSRMAALPCSQLTIGPL